MDGRWSVDGDGGSHAPRDGRVSSRSELPPVCFLLHTRSSRTNQLTAPRLPGVLLGVLLHCCTAVCSEVLVNGCVEGALRRPWWGVGGWAVMYVGVFFRTVGDETFISVSKIPASHRCCEGTTAPTATLLCRSLPYVLLYCRTAAVTILFL